MRITNIVTTSHVNARLDLLQIARENTNIVYNPRRFSAATWRHKAIHGTLLLFPNGKLIHLGAPGPDEPRSSIRRYARILQNQKHTIRLSPCKLVCMSATHKLSGPIDLHEITQFCPGSSYEPECINAAIIKRPECTVCVFHTGTLVITGLKDPDAAYPVILELELVCQ